MLGLTAFLTYFGLDAITTCIADYMYVAGAESNPAMLITPGSYGLVGFIVLKLILSLGLTIPSYKLSTQPNTRITGISTLLAITTGCVLVIINNMCALLTGTSLLFNIFGSGSFVGPGILIGLAMVMTGFVIFIALSLSDRHDHTYKKPRVL